MKKAVIFDLDGTMFDTEKLSKEAFIKVASSINLKLNDDFFNSIMGTTHNSIVKYLDENYPEMLEVFPNVAKVWREMIFSATEVKDSLNKDGLVELLDYLDDNNYKIAVASSSNIEHINRLINNMSKVHHFTTIVSGNDIKHSKPAPDIFLKAAFDMGVSPEECIVIEDSVNGVKAAKSANMTSIYIKDIVQFTSQDYQYVDHECKNLFEVIELLDSYKI